MSTSEILRHQLENLQFMTSPRKRHLFPPIEINNKSTCYPSTFTNTSFSNNTGSQIDDDEPLTPRHSITAADILAPVRPHRRPIGTPPPKIHKKSPHKSEKLHPTNHKTYPSIIIDQDNSQTTETRSSKHPRSATPIPTSPFGRRKRLLPPSRLLKLNSEGTINEKDLMETNPQLSPSSKNNNQVRLMPIKVSPTKSKMRLEVNVPHPFAPD